MTPDPFTKSSLFEQAVRAILRPLVRALIAQGVTATAFYRIVKQTYVEVASDAAGRSATDSQVSVMTGVHRRDVKALRATAYPNRRGVVSLEPAVVIQAKPGYLEAFETGGFIRP